MHAIQVRGTGRVEVPAYGLADAEHQVQKEIRAAWPESHVDVLEVGRPGGAARIVEDFAVTYRITGTLHVAEPTPAAAEREAFRLLRARFDGTRYHQVRWERIPSPGSPTSDAG
ncbi:MAG TPA: hypothetical protein VFH27_04155 [Longimicrobiaceae bacterium]|nr:hypothetical protein [Longimicrobiaceae bacterium]